MSGVVLLLELPTGDLVAVAFPTIDEARAWEDIHEDLGDLPGTVRGVVSLVTRGEVSK